MSTGVCLDKDGVLVVLFIVTISVSKVRYFYSPGRAQFCCHGAWTRMASWLCCSSLPSVYQRLGISTLRGGHKSGSILVS